MIKVSVDGLTEGQARSFTAGTDEEPELDLWTPEVTTAEEDAEEKPILEGRAHDLARNNGYAAGALDIAKDRVVGSYYKLNLRPLISHLPSSVDGDEVLEWADYVESTFQLWADDPDCFIDAQRKMTFTQFLRLGVSYEWLGGEFMFSREFKQTRRTPFGTCFMMIEPDRVETPPEKEFTIDSINNDRKRIIHGIETDKYGEARAYWLRLRDAQLSRGVKTHKRIKRFNRFGVEQFFHVFDPSKAEQGRGVSKFASAIKKLKMLDRYSDATLEAAIIATMYGLVLKSEFGPEALEALGAGGNKDDVFIGMLQQKKEFYKSAGKIKFNGQAVPHLYPNEDLQQLKAANPSDQFADFESAILRETARSMGWSYEQMTGDYTKSNRSSAQAAMEESWNFIKGKRSTVANKAASKMFRLFLDEGVYRGIIQLPRGMGVEEYTKYRAALTNCSWIGAGKGSTDDQKTATANKTKLLTGETTLRKIGAENGEDWREMLNQRTRERRMQIEAIQGAGIELSEEQKAMIMTNGTI